MSIEPSSFQSLRVLQFMGNFMETMIKMTVLQHIEDVTIAKVSFQIISCATSSPTTVFTSSTEEHFNCLIQV